MSTSYQNLALLQNLYRLKSIGFKYIDPFSINENSVTTKTSTLEELALTISNCHLCDLSRSRTQSMSGYGSSNADVFIVDFAVSQTQDLANSYYSGRAGETLTNMIVNVLNYSIEEVYITHCIKCKTLIGNRPSQSEFNSCSSYLYAQLEFVKPKVIITLGDEAYGHLTNDTNNFENVRGHLIDFRGYKLVPIYHPAHLLKNPELKKATMSDLKTIKQLCSEN